MKYAFLFAAAAYVRSVPCTSVDLIQIPQFPPTAIPLSIFRMLRELH